MKLWEAKGHADAYGIEITRTIHIADVGEYSGAPLNFARYEGGGRIWGLDVAMRTSHASAER